MADFSTCAVVGSSNLLVGKGQGAEIDAHSAVIRFNDAPTDGHADDVGGRTTLRIQNVMTCGWHEFSDEICLHYTSWPGALRCPRVLSVGCHLPSSAVQEAKPSALSCQRLHISTLSVTPYHKRRRSSVAERDCPPPHVIVVGHTLRVQGTTASARS